MDRHDEDDRWDYDCPQFVDFTVPMPFNDGADQMFGRYYVGGCVVTFRTLPFPLYEAKTLLNHKHCL